MKQGSPKTNIIFGFLFILMAWNCNSIIFGGFGVFSIVLGIFSSKNYNSKLFLLISSLILVVSLIFAYFQLSSPSYSGNKLINYIFAILFVLITIFSAYDITHDYKLSKISKMENTSQKMKDIIAILLLFIGVIVGLLIGIYIY